jgi:hypothetical protein
MTDTEPSLAALAAASEAVRESLHVQAPATPESLYERSAFLVEILGRLGQVADRLGDQADREVTTANTLGELLDSDDDQPAGDHVRRAREALAAAAGRIEDASRMADQAQSALSHLKLSEL